MTIRGKDLIERIKDKEYSEDLIRELEKYEVKKPESVWELKKDDEIWVTYYNFGKGAFTVTKTRWFALKIDSYNREFGIVHLTKEKAVLHARVLNTELAIKKWKRENDNVELDWDDKAQGKYHLKYDTEIGEIRVDPWGLFKRANTIYFSSMDKAFQCVEDISEERIIEWLKWEDNGQ